jgi:hypothetical protein
VVVVIIAVAAAVAAAVVTATAAVVTAATVVAAVALLSPRPLLLKLPRPLKPPSNFARSDPQALTNRVSPVDAGWYPTKFVERLNLTAGFSLSSFLVLRCAE